MSQPSPLRREPAVERVAGIWQDDTGCLPFGGTPDVNGNGIPDWVYDVAADVFLSNPAEPDVDADGVPDFMQVDANADGVPDCEEWFHSVDAAMVGAGIDPLGDDDGNGRTNFDDYFLGDSDGDGLVNLNDATPCGDPPPGPAGDPSGGFFPIPIPIPVPPGGWVSLPGGAAPATAELSVGRTILMASAGDVDADTDNSSPTSEPDHSAVEEVAEDTSPGLLLQVSAEKDRRRAVLDVKLAAAGEKSRVRFRDDGSRLALFTSDPLDNPAARRLEFEQDYSVGEIGFSVDVFRRMYIEAMGTGRDEVTVEVDVVGDGTWTVVDGLVVTCRPARTESASRWPTRDAATPSRPELHVHQSFLLPAQGIGSQAGRVVIRFGEAAFECPTQRWTDSAIEARVAAIPLTESADGDLVITLPDGRVAGTIPVRIVPPRTQAAVASQSVGAGP